MMIPGRAPRSGCAHHVAIRVEFLRILSEIPDVAVLVLREIIQRIFLEDAIHKNNVVDDPADHAIDHCGSVCDRKLIPQGAPILEVIVNKGGSWLQREKWIVDVGREILGRNVSAIPRSCTARRIKPRMARMGTDKKYARDPRNPETYSTIGLGL